MKWPTLLGVLFGLFAATVSAQTTVVYVTDDDGNVGQYNVSNSNTTVLGSLTASGFTASQVIGLAYDSTTNGVLLFDRSANTVYTMDATTGVTTVLFNTPGVSFQGGAVFGGLVYGINESTQRLAAYTFAGVAQTLSGASLTGHAHSLGVNSDTETLIAMTSTAGIRHLNPDGTEGDIILTSSQTGSKGSEDIAYYGGDYLVASYDRQLYLVNGSTGVSSVFLTTAQLTAMGITGSVSGVDLNFQAVPEPGTWALLLVGIGTITLFTRQYRRP